METSDQWVMSEARDFCVSHCRMEKQRIVDELVNLLTSHEMMLIKVGSLKIKDKKEAMLSKDSKSKWSHKYEGNSQVGGETNKSKKPTATEVQSCYKCEKQ